MKIKDILSIVDKSKQFESIVYVAKMAETMDLGYISNYTEQTRLISYYIGSWYCTDSYVGYKVYFFDDQPVAVSSQTARKSSEDIEWISKDAYQKVKSYILSFKEEEEDNITLCDMDEEIGESYKIEFNGQLFSYHDSIPLLNGEQVKIIERERPKPNEYDLTKKVLIQLKDNTEKWVELKELDFPYNLKKEKLTFNIGGVDYFKKAKYKKGDCLVLDCFGGANEKCKIEMWNETVITVGTDELELTEAK